MSGIADDEGLSESAFADMLADTVFNPNAKSEEKPDENLESQVAEPVVEETAEEVELPEPAFFEKKDETPAADDEPAVLETEVQEPEYAIWARKQYGEDVDLTNPQIAKIAESAYEKERMIGRSQAELQQQRKEMEEEATKQRIASLSQKADLNDEESDWVDLAVESEDPAAYAVAALDNDRRDLYGAILDRWATQGEGQSAKARDLHARVVAAYSQAPPDPAVEFRNALAESFQSVGLNVAQHGDAILAKASELGDANPYVQGMMSQDPNVRAMAVRAVWDLSQSSKMTVQNVVREDDVEARVQEARLREQAAVVGNGSPHQVAPKKGGFWDEFDEELKDRGWDGARPGYKDMA